MKRVHFFSLVPLLIIFFFWIFSCGTDNDSVNVLNEEEVDVSSDKEAILFIGNSHTYYNQGISTHLKKFRGFDNLGFEPLIQEAAQGGFSLEDHLMSSTTTAKVKERAWDAIVLQENTFVASQNLEATTQAMMAFADMVAQHNTKLFLYMTWPYLEDPEMLANIKKTYENGADATGATIVPIGESWLNIHNNEEVPVNLYDSDGIHSSLAGTFFATATFYKSIYDKPPSDNPYQAALGDEVSNYLKTKAN